MKKNRGSPLLALLKSYGKDGDVAKIDELRADLLEKGLLGKDQYIANTLISIYGKCGELRKAEEVFDRIEARDVVSWTALISGYAHNGCDEDALECYRSMMRSEAVAPNVVTFVCALKSCGRIGAIDAGREIHLRAQREGFVESNISLGTALVDMYARCGAMAMAQQVFEALMVRNVVSWTALMAGYVQCQEGEEALRCFERMGYEGLFPDEVAFLSLLKACGTIGAMDKGEAIHGMIVTRGFSPRENALMGTALVDMYAKCGALAKARAMFDRIEARNVVAWNALIAGYAQVGEENAALDLLGLMISHGIEPDLVTFTGVLNACSHSGLVEQGQMWFDAMSSCYGIVPTPEHRTCMVDLLGRAGHFDRLVCMIMVMPSSDYLPIWASLLGSCRSWGNVMLGKLAFEHAIRLDPGHAPAYVSMRNIYVAAGMLEEADRIDALRLQNEAWLDD